MNALLKHDKSDVLFHYLRLLMSFTLRYEEGHAEIGNNHVLSARPECVQNAILAEEVVINYEIGELLSILYFRCGSDVMAGHQEGFFLALEAFKYASDTCVQISFFLATDPSSRHRMT
ncbi:hypothetical protein GCM10009764_80350 [Nocardia ninae]|uniref:Uncharacterized protein n=1 Tax=Nocardia ninae NBRC 108245 TaxID=1210091 RepID=A0A511MP09_9NOCA|nr:hypothetical protein NN4_63960 [Nocardia ninae NBRC 108245]